MNVKEIVKRWLIENKYDGLYNDGCGCEIDDLSPCGEMCDSCQAGVKVEGCICGDGCDFHIGYDSKHR